jgi:N-methylhydantoinase A
MLLGVDVGGTFTDAVLIDRHSQLHTAKVTSTPSDQSVAVLQAVRLVVQSAGAQAADVERFAHGMTVATNALLEGRTARTALLATEGFTDVIELARQNRPHLYRLCAAAPTPLVPAKLRVAVPERMGPDGPLRPLCAIDAEAAVERLAQARPDAVAVSLLHSYADPAHEQLLAATIARLLPDVHVSLSSDLVGTFHEYERTATTVLDAALSPLLGSYLRQLVQDAHAIGLREPAIMQSSGGLTDAAHAGAHAALTVLSGPAGGVGGALLLSNLAGEPDVLCFDMGGTSCDVSLIEDGHVAETSARTIAERPLSLPALDIHTVGAGGGSIAWRDTGGALRVGPASAGATPGPACYGLGGTQATVTDANLLLGRLLEDAPLAGGLTLDRDAAEHAISRLAQDLRLGTIACAEGIVRVAEAHMLGALRLMSVERGVDPRGFALMPFGGAGPLHAASLARQLGVSRVLCPRASGVLCALGLAAAAPRRDASRTVMLGSRHGRALERSLLEQERAALIAHASTTLSEPPTRVRVRYELRYRGQSFELAVEEEIAPDRAINGLDPDDLRSAFAQMHEQRYGYRDEISEVELVNIRVSAWGAAPELRPTASAASSSSEPQTRSVILDGRPTPTAILRGAPAPGSKLEGPALCALPEATLLIPHGWSAHVDEHGTVCLLDSVGNAGQGSSPA